MWDEVKQEIVGSECWNALAKTPVEEKEAT